MNSAIKNVIFWAVMAVTAILIWAVAKSSTNQPVLRFSFAQFLHEVAQDNVREVTITAPGNGAISRVQGVLRKDSLHFETAASSYDTGWLKALTDKNAGITFVPEESAGWETWLANGLPIILILLLWIYIMRRMEKRGRQDTQSPPASTTRW